MPLVYRVENAEGIGMYWGSSRAGQEMNGDWERHPPPSQDTKLIENWDLKDIMSFYDHFNKFYFGFVSLDQLNFWIYNDKWKATLKEDGFFIAVYEVETLYVGNTQAVFPKDAKKILVDKIEF